MTLVDAFKTFGDCQYLSLSQKILTVFGLVLFCSSCQTLGEGLTLNILQDVLEQDQSGSTETVKRLDRVVEAKPKVQHDLVGESVGVVETRPDNSRMSDSEERAIINALKEAALGAERQHRYASAAVHYRRLTELNPRDAGVTLGLARNLRYVGSSNDAVLILKASSLLEQERLLQFELVKAQIASGLLSDAEENLTALEKVAADNWELYALKGLIYDHTGRFSDAQRLYNEALQFSPRNVSVLNNLSISLAQSGKLDEAISLLSELANSEYTNPQLRQNLALLYGLKGDFVKASSLASEDLPPETVAGNLATFQMIHD